jgi:type I restriction enzyme S subunit
MTKANGSTRYGLTKDTIESAKIFKPKMPEQEMIVERLNCAEEKIQIEKKALSKQTQLKQGLMQDLLTGKVPVKADPLPLLSDHG